MHKIVGHINKKKNITGWIKNNCIEPSRIYSRHSQIVQEMKKRKYNHNSALGIPNIDYLDPVYRRARIDRDKSLEDLSSRCPMCRKRIKENSD